MSDGTFDSLLQAQRELQQESFDTDPIELCGQARAEYIRWNVLALEDELHEALQELRWKPWTTPEDQGRWVHRDAYVKELVDALHFLLNLFLVADVQSREVVDRYFAKREVNAQRQRDGYAGAKDSDGRATDEP